MDRHQELTQLQRRWAAPVELARSTPREVELSAGGKSLVAVAVALVLGAVGMAVGLSHLVARQESDSHAIATGTETDAVITRHWRSGDKESTRRIAYEFVHAGRTYKGATKTPRNIWARLGVGSSIRVRFAPDRPELNHPVDWSTGNMPWWFPGSVGAVLVAAAALLMWILKRDVSLLADGRPTLGVVTKHTRGQHGTAIVYEFLLLGGGVGKGRGSESRKPLAVGSMLTIVYDRDNPKRKAIYPMSMVRVVR